MPFGSLSRTLTRTTLRLVPLTPVHIGDGTEMRLDEYVLDDPASRPRTPRYDEYGEEIEDAPVSPGRQANLCRFDPVRAIRTMSRPVELTRFRTALDHARLGDAAKELRAAGQRCIEERIPISRASLDELRSAMDDSAGARTGAVHPFVRTNGYPYIPGSSIKGAFRTALASAALPREGRDQGSWDHGSAMQAALGVDPHDTATDPLRFLHVSDVMLPEAYTVIDRAEMVHPGKPDARKMQMHYERTRSLVDDRKLAPFEVSLTIDSRAMAVAARQARFSRNRMIDTVREFHWKVFNGELSAFFKESKDSNQALTGMLAAHKAPDGRSPASDGKFQTDFLLLRLGRFGHFESKSLEGVRRGHFPQLKKFGREIGPPGQGGHTRTIVRIGDKAVPFGWVIGWVVKEEIL